MGKDHELSEFELLVYKLAGKPHINKVIAHILKVSKSTITYTIAQHANSSHGLKELEDHLP